jgi:hypothetical protein
VRNLLSPELETTIQRVSHEMVAHSDHAIIPANRLAIYNLLDENNLAERPTFKKLSLMTAQHVLAIWQNARSADATTEHILNTAELVLQNKISPEVAKEELEKASERMENFGATEEARSIGNAFYAGQAAVECLMAVLGKAPFDDVPLDEDSTDADLDPWSSDTAHWAADAYAGKIGGTKSDAAKRQEFWEWWLQHAIPQALNSN